MPEVERKARRKLAKGTGVMKTARLLGIGTGTVQRIKAEMLKSAAGAVRKYYCSVPSPRASGVAGTRVSGGRTLEANREMRVCSPLNALAAPSLFAHPAMLFVPISRIAALRYGAKTCF